MVSQRALLPRSRPIGLYEVRGAAAVAAGIAYLSAALFSHCHWFWSAHPEYHGHAQLGKLAALLGIVGGLGYLLYLVLMIG